MTNSRQNSRSSDPLGNINLDGWIMPEIDDPKWNLGGEYDFDFSYTDLPVQNNETGRARLFSIPSDSSWKSRKSSVRAASAKSGTNGAHDLSLLKDLLPTQTANDESGDHGSFPNVSAKYPAPSIQPLDNPYFVTAKQNVSVNTSSFPNNQYVDAGLAGFKVPLQDGYPQTMPTDGIIDPFSNSPATPPRPMAAARRGSSSLSGGGNGNRRYSSNTTDSDEYTAALPTKSYKKERPKYDPKHPWHRINTTTRGTNKRSGKINQYEAEKMYKQGLRNPFVPWSSPNYNFDYYDHGELTQLEYSADEIREFIYHHPHSQDRKLLLWIQKTPADSGRRYHTPTLAKCRFSECPSRQYGLSGTIWNGHMRVALDERSVCYKDKADPFYMAGFFHLYCFEKFLDLPAICRLSNVEVHADTRQLANEPNMKWSASLSAAKEGIVARRFIESCRRGKSHIRDFDRYPRNPDFGPGDYWPYDRTLGHRMQVVKEGDRARSSKESLAKRQQRATQIHVNLGDLEMACKAKAAMRKHPFPPPPRSKPAKRRMGSWISEVDSDYVSEASETDDDGLQASSRKKSRRGAGNKKTNHSGEGPSTGVAIPAGYVQAADQQQEQQATLRLDPADLQALAPFDHGQHQQDAWPQYTSGPGINAAPASASAASNGPEIISSPDFSVLDPSLFVPVAVAAPTASAPAPGRTPTSSTHHQRQDLTVPDHPANTFSAPLAPIGPIRPTTTPFRLNRRRPNTTSTTNIHLTSPFRLASPFAPTSTPQNVKRSAPSDDGNEDNYADHPPAKRVRVSVPLLDETELAVSPKTRSSARCLSPSSSANGSVWSPRRSARLSLAMASVSASSGSRGSQLSRASGSVGSLGSLGSLFGRDLVDE